MECRRLVQIFLPILLLLTVFGTVSAEPSSDLYSVVIQVTDNTMATRNQHLPQAFEQVIKRVSSSHATLTHPQYLAASQNIERFVSHYFYTNNADAFVLTLRFNEQMINDFLHKIDRKTLGKNRQPVLLWIVQQDAQGAEFISNDHHSDTARKISSLAVNYGVPVIMPLVDLTERLFISETDVINNNLQPLQLAGERYSAETMLLGVIKQQNSEWVCEWRLLDGTSNIAWSSASNNLDAELEVMINNLADQLIAVKSNHRNTILADAGITVDVQGVACVADYAKVVDALKNLSVVGQVEIGSVHGNHATFTIHAIGGKERVLHALKTNRVLSLAPGANLDNQALNHLDLIYRMS